MKITITNIGQEFNTTAAWRIIAQILGKKNSVIGLSTGRTTGGIHAAVADVYKKFPFDASQVTVFNLDELTNVPREYFGGCYTMIRNEICIPMGIPEENIIMPPTISDNFEEEGRLFEERIMQRGGIDLQVLGIGENGHLGFNQPGTPFERTTWLSVMDTPLEERVRRETQSPKDANLGGLTLGIKNIMQSRKIVLVANGARKADIIKAALLGPVTVDVPASVLQLHPDCEAILDVEAAAGILLVLQQNKH